MKWKLKKKEEKCNAIQKKMLVSGLRCYAFHVMQQHFVDWIGDGLRIGWMDGLMVGWFVWWWLV